MTLHALGKVTAVTEPSSRQPRRRTWKTTLLIGAFAVLLVAVGVTIGRATAPDPQRAEPLDFDALAAAWGSGDADQIRAFYTDDAVMMPFGHILATLNGHPMPEYWDVAGPAIVREAYEHEGGTYESLDARQIGNMVVATGQWTSLPTAPEGTVIKTADILHLRNGKIWRHFADFEVYVDGELVEM